MALLGAKSLLCLSFVSSVFAAVTPKALQHTNVLPGGFIVEWDGESLVDPKPNFYRELSQNLDVTHRIDFSSSIFKGVSFHVDAGLDQVALAKDVKAMSMVKDIWPIKLYNTQDVKTRAPAAYTNGTSSNSTADTSTTHIMGGVDKLHAEGLTGEGIFVAIIDTGIAYNHPALGGGFGPGYKVAYGYDLVGDDYTGYNVPVPDDDPFVDCVGGDHGTHVAGIVAAGPNPYNFTGVAPDATLGSYRVFGCDGSAGDDVLIAAFTRAYEDGADVITASIGGINGWTEEAWSVAVSRIVAAGTPCTLAAGNDGSEGMFYGSSAADGIGVIGVGSIDNIESPVFTTYGTYTVDGSDGGQFGYEESSVGMPNVTLPLIALDYDTTIVDNACNPLPTDTPDLSGKLVLVRRGTCTYSTKATNIAAYGGQYIIFYNNVEGLVVVSVSADGLLGAIMVDSDQGATWISELKAGSEIVASITGTLTVFTSPANNITGGYMSTFSEWNPTNEVYIKPEISAPGGSILSTVPLTENGGYGVKSGTSMATPYIAGVVALMLQARADLDPETIRSILATTARPLKFNDGETTYPYLAPAIQQGGGEVNAYASVYTSTVIDVPNISFNDSAHFVPEANFTIKNRGSAPITYTLSYVDAATGYTLPADGSNYPSAFPVDLVTNAASISLSTSLLTVPAGGSETVLVTLTPPEGLTTSRIPVYSGFIKLNGTNGDALSLPYAGVASSLKDAVVLDPAIGYPYLTSSADSTLTPVDANTVFTISLSNATSNATNATGVPELVIGLTMPSALIRADLIASNSSLASSSPSYTNATTILGVKTLGPIVGSPYVYQPRGNAWNQLFYGGLADGTQVPAGSYSILVRALRIFGDPANEDDYDSGSTVDFTIKYVS